MTADSTAPVTTEDNYWQREAQRARAERDALALGVLRLADAWVKEFGETGIRPEVCAATLRSAVETMGWR